MKKEIETLTIILMKEKNVLGYTAFIKEHSNVVAQGDTKLDAAAKALEILEMVLEDEN